MARYSPACTRLLSQYETMSKLVEEGVFRRTVHASISSPWNLVTCLPPVSLLRQMDHPAALHTIKAGVPATVEHSSEAGAETGKCVAETTQSFITFMDALKLRIRAKDQLHPILRELVTGYARFKGRGEKQDGWLVYSKPSQCLLKFLIALFVLQAENIERYEGV